MAVAPQLAGKAAVVTGSGSGLGREVLLGMAERGASVVGVDVNAEAGQRVVDEALQAGGRAVFQHGDVTREEDIEAAIRRCRAEFGDFNVIHNNAGLQVEAQLHETSNEQWEALVAVNMRSVFWGCKHAIAAMRETGGGSIINTASLVAITTDPFIAAYCATKAGVVGITRAVAVGYIKENIRCNAVCPGDMDTPMIQRYFDKTPDPAASRKWMNEQYPGGRIAHPREVARAVIFLASDDASFVNGESLLVDGGIVHKTY